MSRTDLARALNLSAQSISEIVTALEQDGHVQATGAGASSGGRRPILYTVRQENLRAIGVHIGTDHVAALISDLSGEIYSQASAQCSLADGPSNFVAALQVVVEELLARPEAARLAGIGLGVPVTMHRRDDKAVRLAATPGWQHDGVDLQEVLQEYRLPVVAENRAHVVAVGEHLFGSAQDVGDLFCLMLEQGIGGAVMTRGRLFTGGDGGAGAVGRMILDPPGDDGPRRRVSDLAGAGPIVRTATERLRAARRRKLAGLWLADVGIDQVIDEALAGDEMMAEVIHDAGRVLGAVAAATLCVTDSRLVLLCGSITRAGSLLVEPLIDELRDRWPFDLPEVRLGRLGASAVALGAAALVLTDKVGPADQAVTR